MVRRKLDESELQRLADRLQAVMAAYGLTETAVAAGSNVEQSFVNRIKNRKRIVYESAPFTRLLAYVNMQESPQSPEQIQLPFEATAALNRFIRARGDFGLLASLLDLLSRVAGPA